MNFTHTNLKQEVFDSRHEDSFYATSDDVRTNGFRTLVSCQKIKEDLILPLPDGQTITLKAGDMLIQSVYLPEPDMDSKLKPLRYSVTSIPEDEFNEKFNVIEKPERYGDLSIESIDNALDADPFQRAAFASTILPMFTSDKLGNAISSGTDDVIRELLAHTCNELKNKDELDNPSGMDAS